VRAIGSAFLALQAFTFSVPYAPVVTEQQLADDLTRAMKAREMPRVYVLRGLLTAVKNLKVEKRGAALEEADVVQLVRREIRKREEAEEFAVKAGRHELIEQNRAERAMLETYVPRGLEAIELEQAIREIAARPDRRSLGAVMSELRTRFAGRFDGRQASELARRVLAEPTTD
jgi:uncharacterized protein YqeY